MSIDVYRKTPRTCRVGAGTEKDSGTGNTPGFPLVHNDCIMFDNRGFKTLHMKRTFSNRLNQSSMIMLQSWRANCDVKLLLYDTHPKWPDIKEISNVSDYIVSYTCKGHMTQVKERDIIISSINKYVFFYSLLLSYLYIILISYVLFLISAAWKYPVMKVKNKYHMQHKMF